MKIGVHLQCMPQDDEYIAYCIKAIQHLDAIVVTCPTKYMWEERTRKMEINPQDKTIEILLALQKSMPDKVYLIFKEGWHFATDQFRDAINKFLQIGFRVGDSLLHMMPDEIWRKDQLDKFLEFSKNGTYNVTPLHLAFFGSMEWWTPSAEGRNYPFSEDLFINPNGWKFESRLDSWRMDGAHFAKDIYLHHFTWCHNRKHFDMKLKWNDVLYSERPRAKGWDVLNKWIQNPEKTPTTFNLDAGPRMTQKYNQQIYGDFPDVIKAHPYYGKSVNEVLDCEV